MIQANLHNSDQLSNPTLRIAHKLEKTEFQKFYQGFPCYSSFEVDNDGITYFLQSPPLAEYWKLQASKFIDENGLDLEVIGTGKISTTFIIKRK